MQMIGVHFYLEAPHFLNVVMPLEVAKDLMAKWGSGAYEGKATIGGQSPQTGCEGWVIRIDSIRGMHTFPVEALAQVPTQAQPTQGLLRSGNQSPAGWNPLGRSGL